MITNCPCCSGKSYEACCGLFISGEKSPLTPEELMRSRYSAYALGHVNYIRDTMKSPAADDFDLAEAQSWSEQVKWLKLEVISSSMEGDTGQVEFLAHLQMNNQRQHVHEVSQFIREDQRWYYIDGYDPCDGHPAQSNKVGRNEPCPCGSGKKFKKCCG